LFRPREDESDGLPIVYDAKFRIKMQAGPILPSRSAAAAMVSDALLSGFMART
jgi:hypothetical protein